MAFRAFLAGLALLVFCANAQASTPSCVGVDLVAKMARDDKPAFEAYRKEAATIPNADGLLWKIEKRGVAPSYLFGTFHANDARLMAVLERAAPQIRASKAVATELGSMTRLAKALAIARVTLKAMSAKDDTLTIVADPDKRKRIEAMIAERRIDVDTARKMEPWLLLTLFALPTCELLKADRVVVDDRVVETAEDRKIAVEALETVDEQLAAIASLDGPFVGRYLASVADRPSMIDDAFETMVRLYTEGRVGAALPALRNAFKMDASEYELNRVYMKRLLGDRNIVMRDRSRPLLAKGGAFIAVGALHLSGADGLVELYRKDGYKVTRQW